MKTRTVLLLASMLVVVSCGGGGGDVDNGELAQVVAEQEPLNESTQISCSDNDSTEETQEVIETDPSVAEDAFQLARSYNVPIEIIGNIFERETVIIVNCGPGSVAADFSNEDNDSSTSVTQEDVDVVSRIEGNIQRGVTTRIVMYSDNS